MSCKCSGSYKIVPAGELHSWPHFLPSDLWLSTPAQVKLFMFEHCDYHIPRLRVSAAEGVGPGAQEALERLLPTHLMVLPKPRREREVELPMEGLTVTKAIVVPNLPFKKAGVKG